MDPLLISELQKEASRHEVWTILIGIVTGLLAIWTFYKDFWEGPNISLYSGDSIDLVKSTDFITRKIHVGCTFTNRSRKAGIVSKVALELITPDSQRTVFRWQLFYRYEGSHSASPDSKVIPISVPGNSSVFQGIEFQTPDEVKWDAGKWGVRVVAWAGQDCVDGKPSMKDQFNIVLSAGFIADLLRKNTNHVPILQTVMVEGRDINPTKLD